MEYDASLIEWAEPTGSRYICNPPPMDTDEDWLISIKEENFDKFEKDLIARGFRIGGSRPTDIEPFSNLFTSYVLKNLNLIVSCDKQFLDKFLFATKLAKDLNLLCKSQRIDLFQSILYGN